jgi:hypothetical protein
MVPSVFDSPPLDKFAKMSNNNLLLSRKWSKSMNQLTLASTSYRLIRDIARQSPSEVRGLSAVPPLRPSAVRSTSPEVCTSAGAMGLKVSDEFTVPLCRTHHREIHRYGDEPAWWNKRDLDPLNAASNLWRQTHPLPTRPQSSDSDGSAAEAQNIQNGKGAGGQVAIQDSPHDKTNPIIPTGSQ